MLLVHDPGTRALTAARELPEAGWVHVVAPDGDERERLRRRAVPDEFIGHGLDQHEIARVDHDDGATLITLRVPRDAGRGPRTATLGVVMIGGLLVTIASEPLEVVTVAARRCATDRPLRILLEVVLSAASAFTARVDAIEREVDRLEEALRDSMRNREVLALLEHQKGLVYLERALVSDEIMLDHLRQDARHPIAGEDRELLEDAIVEVRQAIQMTKISADILASMMDAFASIISNNLNVVMRQMAALTIMLAVPTMLASLWGMNVAVPGADRTWAFFGIVGAAVLVTIGVGLLFWRKRWL